MQLSPRAQARSSARSASRIAEVGYLQLGGVRQWVMIRGDDLANPALVLLHGGPGLSETPFFRHFNAPLEKSFNVVHWDQRGAGKSFDPKIRRSSMTVEQLVSDLDQLVDDVRRRLGKTQVTILGHSWGSALGTLYAARYPEKVAAYVGCAQVGDWAMAERASYAFALEQAERQRKHRIARKLRAIGQPPHTAQSAWIERTCVARLDGSFGARLLWNMGRAVFGTPEASIFELRKTMRAFRWTLDAMWPEVSRMNLSVLAPSLRVPAFFFLGRRDHWIPPQASLAYIDALDAPSKKLVWFEESGHDMFVDEPAKFNADIVDLVRPVSMPARALA